MEVNIIEAMVHGDESEHEIFLGISEEAAISAFADYLREEAEEVFEEILPEDDQAAIDRYGELNSSFWYSPRWYIIADAKKPDHGWSNEETWIAALELQNSPLWMIQLTSMAKQLSQADLAEHLRITFGPMPKIQKEDYAAFANMKVRIMEAAFSRINWEEIAAMFREGIADTPTQT
jgi:hypothetical protein